MDKLFGEVDYVEAGEQETEAEKVETVTYEEAIRRTGSTTSAPEMKGNTAQQMEVKRVEDNTVNEKV